MFKKFAVPIFLAAIMALGILSSTASADGTTSESAYVHSKVTSVAFKVVKQKGWVGVQEHIKIQHVAKSECGWYSWFWNSDYLVGETNEKPQMYKDHHGYLCPDKYSPTGWVKRGGGHTGSDCGNIAAPPFVKPKYPVVKPPTIEINSSTKLKLKVTVTAEATATKSCGSANATGSAFDFISVKESLYIKSKHSEALRLKLAGKAVAKAKDRAEATVEVKCEGSSTTTPPPPCSTCHEEKPPCSTCHEEEKPSCETCKPPCKEVEFFGEYEFEEAHVNEGPIQYWKYINAPQGDQLTVYFETEHGSFSPEFVQVSSFGAETTKFQSYWTAPSHPGHYAVWVRVVDHTCEKSYVSAKQFVTVLPWELEEPPR